MHNFSDIANKVPTPHNKAHLSEIASTVLLPGDPRRAQFIAENYLTDSKKITDIRGMLGFTGTYNDKKVTVMGSGMGGPSAGIYSYELFAFYQVKQIIRIGTAGGFLDSQKMGDLIFALTASTDSNYAYQYDLPGTFSPAADFLLLKNAVDFAEKRNYQYHTGTIFSSDCFSSYNARGEERAWKPWARVGCLGQDMETYALYCNASFLQKKALSILTIVSPCSQSSNIQENTSSSVSLDPMITTALSLI